jgi:hypothetical protein
VGDKREMTRGAARASSGRLRLLPIPITTMRPFCLPPRRGRSPHFDLDVSQPATEKFYGLILLRMHLCKERQSTLIHFRSNTQRHAPICMNNAHLVGWRPFLRSFATA